MNIFCSANGTIFHVDTEPIYQGSVGVNKIRFIGQFPSSSQVLMRYCLPNGVWTTPIYLTHIPDVAEVEAPNGGKFNVWEGVIGATPKGKDDSGQVLYDLDYTITEHFGQASIQFDVYGAGVGAVVNGVAKNGGLGRLCTATASINIIKGVPMENPDFTELDLSDANNLLAQILNGFSDVRMDVNVLSGDVSTLTERVSSAEGTVNDFANKAAQNEADIDGLQNKVSQNENDIEGLQNKMAQSESDIDNLQNDLQFVENLAKGAQQGVSYENYEEAIAAINELPQDAFRVGQSIYIKDMGVPDLWVYGVFATHNLYQYDTDEAFIDEINSNDSARVGYYAIAKLETDKVNLDYTQVMSNGKLLHTLNIDEYAKTTALEECVKFTEYPTWNDTGETLELKAGVVKVGPNSGMQVSYDGELKPYPASSFYRRNKTGIDLDKIHPITVGNLNEAVKATLTDNYKIALTGDEQAKAFETIFGAPTSTVETIPYISASGSTEFFDVSRYDNPTNYGVVVIVNGRIFIPYDDTKVLNAYNDTDATNYGVVKKAIASQATETWHFTLADGTTATKNVVVK